MVVLLPKVKPISVAAFYYLMAADGEIGSTEQEKLRQIAAEIELEGFESCLEEIQAEYENRQKSSLCLAIAGKEGRL